MIIDDDYLASHMPVRVGCCRVTQEQETHQQAALQLQACH